jgi:hypothetical protein
VVATIYALFGVSFWIAYCFGKAPYLPLPVGLVALWCIQFQFPFSPHHGRRIQRAALLGLRCGICANRMADGVGPGHLLYVAARLKGIDADFISFREPYPKMPSS